MTTERQTWAQAFHNFLDRRALYLLFLGFSAGIPLLLIFSTLSLWLGEAGIEKKTLTYFSWAALGYSFKFVWAPLVNTLPIPLLHKWLGQRRSWLLIAQLCVMAAILGMGLTNPQLGILQLKYMALFAVLLGFSSATQDIVIDAYRIEIAETRLQTVLAAMYNAGYRLGMIVSGAGALYLASALGTSKEVYIFNAWRTTYMAMAGVMVIGLITTLVIREPAVPKRSYHFMAIDYTRLVALFVICVSVFIITAVAAGRTWVLVAPAPSLLVFIHEVFRIVSALTVAGFVGALLVRQGLVSRQLAHEVWIAPIVDFFKRYGVLSASLLLLLVGLYRISDIVSGVISNVFYQDMGFSKNDIATAVKVVGVICTLLGGFIGGLSAQRYSIIRILFVGGLLASLTNLAFIGLAHAGHDYHWLYFAVLVDNLASGFAGAAFVAFLSSLTSMSFTAVQYAIFSSIMTLIPKVIGGYSGGMVEAMGYPQFFILTALMGVPILVLIVVIEKRLMR